MAADTLDPAGGDSAYAQACAQLGKRRAAGW